MQANAIEICVKCGDECVLGINAYSTSEGIVCEDCSNPRRGYSSQLLPEERESLRESLISDIQLRPTYEDFLKKALIEVVAQIPTSDS